MRATPSITQFRMRVLSFTRRTPADTLLARVEQGDPTALGEVYDLHHEAVRAFAERLVGDRPTAEDLVHEVFVQLPRVIGKFRGDSSLRTFLTGIAVNRARHFVRAAARRRAAMARMQIEPSVVASPEDERQRHELLAALVRCLDQLPLDQRVAFVLCEVEERSSKEAADIVGCPEATLRTRLFHARKKLRALLTEEGIQ